MASETVKEVMATVLPRTVCLFHVQALARFPVVSTWRHRGGSALFLLFAEFWVHAHPSSVGDRDGLATATASGAGRCYARNDHHVFTRFDRDYDVISRPCI